MTEELTDWTQGQPGLVHQVCGACHDRWYFQRQFCPRCGSTLVATRPSACTGIVHAITTVVRAPSPEWRERAPYGLALVDLDEAVRVMTHADPALAIGNRVRIEFRPAPAGVIPYATPLTPAKDAAR